MKISKKIILFLAVLLFSFVLLGNFSYAATTTVKTEDELKTAIANSSNGDVITLTEDIALTAPIEVVGKNITINGNGHTISKNADNWTPNGSNGTLITASLADAKLTLVHLKLTGAQKYGVQSYDGAHVVLNGVTISDCGFGGVLVNAGTVEVKNLILNKNGQDNNNGIEIAKGNGVYTEGSKPVLIMNGTLSSTEKENVVYIAVNDKLSTFEVKNTDTTVNKILTSGNKVVVTDEKNNVLFESNENPNVPITGDTYTPTPSTPKPDTKPDTSKPVKDDTPQTGINGGFAISFLVMILSATCFVLLKNKKIGC